MNELQPNASLLSDIRQLIESARSRAASCVNVELTILYWRIGKRINEEILQGKRAGYGEEIMTGLSRQLTAEFGSSFSKKNLHRMRQFSESYPDEQFVVSLIRQLSWTHFIALIPLEDPLKREYYAEMCRLEGWSVRQQCRMGQILTLPGRRSPLRIPLMTHMLLIYINLHLANVLRMLRILYRAIHKHSQHLHLILNT